MKCGYLLLFSLSCNPAAAPVLPVCADTLAQQSAACTVPLGGAATRSDTTLPQRLVAFSKTLVGTPYRYASADPHMGFDCSGFITYVFNHFNITVPRSSVDFTNQGEPVTLKESKPGDLVLFTGTDPKDPVVGHMGIIVSNSNGDISFIHSTSGARHGVTITQLNDYYMGRFVKVVRMFREK